MNTGKPLCILFIDDSEDDALIFGSALQQIYPGVNYIYMGRSEEALQALKALTLTPDYIFVDLFMPRLSGLEVIKEIKQIKECNHIPVIICSGVKYDLDIEEAKNLGAASFMPKPNNIADLKAAISEALQNR